MASLPPLILALQERGTPSSTLVAHRFPGDGNGVAQDCWPTVPRGALLVTWPTGFRWDSAGGEFREEVSRRGGVWFALPLVLRAAGVQVGRGLPGLLATLAPEVAEVEDPEHLGEILVEGLARLLEEALEGGGSPETVSPFSALPPVLRETIELLPQRPGVYTFQTADGRALYVGKAKALRRRVRSHFLVGDDKGVALARGAHRLLWTEVGGDLEAALTEYQRIVVDQPSLNVQERVRRRNRGSEYRAGVFVLLLPGPVEGRSALCLVTGGGGFHWEEVPRRRVLPRDTWSRLRPYLVPEGPTSRTGGGWAPGEPGRPLGVEEERALAELALSWVARHGDAVTSLRPRPGESPRELQRRLRDLVALDPHGDRTEVR